MKDAEKKAEMPIGANAVLDRRTVANANANLLKLVKKGYAVLDVGCGTGAITKDIVDLVGREGSVKGIDTSVHLIELAQCNFSHIKNLDFELADINVYECDKKYDVVTSARVLQWLSNPREVAMKMKALLREGGCLTIVDYNHERIEFTPEVPASMKKLYTSFLKWRQDSGMDNRIADNLENIFKAIGLKNITVEDQPEISVPEKDSFFDELSIWKKVAETRGNQLVNDHYITEDERILAIEEYQHWMEREAWYMKLYLRVVTGYK